MFQSKIIMLMAIFNEILMNCKSYIKDFFLLDRSIKSEKVKL